MIDHMVKLTNPIVRRPGFVVGSVARVLGELLPERFNKTPTAGEVSGRDPAGQRVSVELRERARCTNEFSDTG